MNRLKVVLFVALLALVAMMAGPVSALEPSGVVTPPDGTPGIAGDVTASVLPRPVFRLTNRYNGGVFYTDSAAVVADLDINRHDEFLYEGTAFFYDPAQDTIPVHRLYNKQNGTYFYGGVAERNTALTYYPSVFVDHGVAFYVSPYSGPDKLAVLRFSVPKVADSWLPKDCSYFLTASETECTTLLANYPVPAMMLEGAIGFTSGGLHVGSGTGSVSGAVTGPSGAPQAGVWVRVTMEDLYSSTWFARTDGSGAYTVTGLPTGEYHVAFSTWPNCYDDGWKVVSSAYYDSVGVVDGANTPNINIRLHALPQAIYRFFHKGNGTHFYTPTEGERDKVIAEWSSIYRYEGVAYHVDAAISSQPLYRFFNLKNGSHFYTASTTERDKVRATWPNIYRYEGETYSVSPSAQPGTKAVYRFFKYDTGSHFYTASAEERDTVQANWPRIFRYEGVAFYVNQ